MRLSALAVSTDAISTAAGSGCWNVAVIDFSADAASCYAVRSRKAMRTCTDLGASASLLLNFR